MSADGFGGRKLRALEAFAGAGGAALGLRAAGFSSIACLEWDKDAAATLAAAGFPAIHGDVRGYQPTERPDLLWASPPCQAWSSAGKRGGATDERNGWPWTFDLCDRARPTWMVCENVPGLLMHSGEANCDRAGSEPIRCPGCYWLAVILPEARRRFAVVEWRVLDAASFGVPQRRHRVFLVCGPTAIRWPEPTHADPDTLRQGSMFGPKLQPWWTVRQALGLGGYVRNEATNNKASPADAPVTYIARTPIYAHPERDPGKRARIDRVYGGGSNPRGKDAAHERTYRDLTDEPSTTVAAEQIGNAGPFVVMREDPSRGWDPSGTDAPSPSVRGGRPGGGIGIRTLNPDRPAFTLRAQGGTDASGHEGGHASVYVPDPKHPPFNPDEPAGSIRSGGGGHSAPQHLITTSRNGRKRIEYPLRDQKIDRGPSDAFRRHPVESEDSPASTLGALRPAFIERSCYAPGQGRAASEPERLDEPAPSVTGQEVKGTRASASSGFTFNGGPDRASDAAFLAAGIRRLTVLECATLQDFPPDHPWQGTQTSRYRQVGNAVPPTLARVVGEAVAEAIVRANVEGA